jgi:hypothetical protein
MNTRDLIGNDPSAAANLPPTTNPNKPISVEKAAQARAAAADKIKKKETLAVSATSKQKSSKNPERKRHSSSADEEPARKRVDSRKYVYICSAEGCTNIVVRGGVCIRHGAKVEPKRCSSEGWTNQAQ